MHALSCNEIRDITALLLDEVCTDVRKEPMLLELNGETLHERSANTKKEARLDVSARGFWVTGQRVFCDVRVFDLRRREVTCQFPVTRPHVLLAPLKKIHY